MSTIFSIEEFLPEKKLIRFFLETGNTVTSQVNMTLMSSRNCLFSDPVTDGWT